MQVPPNTLNGYPIIHQKLKADKESWFIMAYREGVHDPFVVATWHPNCGTTEWVWGHYFPNLIEAVEYFKGRTK